MPWTAFSVRVLMYLGGVGGLAFAALIWTVAVTLRSGNEYALDFLQGVEQQEGIQLSQDEASGIFGIVGLIPFTYAVLSLLLAAFAGRRSRAILWMIVAFHKVAALLLVLNFLGGSVYSTVPFFFALVMAVMMLTGSARDYYRKPPPGPHAPLH